MKDDWTPGCDVKADVPDDHKGRHYDVFEEIVIISRYLQKHGMLNKINEHVHFARKRFGRYDVIDYLAVLFGYAISGERTLAQFYARLQPFATPFMAQVSPGSVAFSFSPLALFGSAHRGSC